jgi:hypothetical protein
MSDSDNENDEKEKISQKRKAEEPVNCINHLNIGF